MGLYHVLEKGNQSKLLGIREPAGEGAPVGYLKGTLEDKTRNFFLPIEQQLKAASLSLKLFVSAASLIRISHII